MTQEIDSLRHQLTATQSTCDTLQQQLKECQDEHKHKNELISHLENNNVEYMRKIRYLESTAAPTATDEKEETSVEQTPGTELVLIQSLLTEIQQLKSQLAPPLTATSTTATTMTGTSTSNNNKMNDDDLQIQLIIERNNNDILSAELKKRNENIMQLQSLLKQYTSTTHNINTNTTTTAAATVTNPSLRQQYPLPPPPPLPPMSPAFSEDYGAVSIPASPTFSVLGADDKAVAATALTSDRDHYNSNNQYMSTSRRKSPADTTSTNTTIKRPLHPFFPASPSPSTTNIYNDNDNNEDNINTIERRKDRYVSFSEPNINNNNNNNEIEKLRQQVEQLTTTNENLKGVIRSMRIDMEALTRTLTTTPTSNNASDNTKPPPPPPPQEVRLNELTANQNQLILNYESAIKVLKQRLEQSTAEIVRLRTERRKLMELGNEMKATLLRHNITPGTNTNTNTAHTTNAANTAIVSQPSMPLLSDSSSLYTTNNKLLNQQQQQQYSHDSHNINNASMMTETLLTPRHRTLSPDQMYIHNNNTTQDVDVSPQRSHPSSSDISIEGRSHTYSHSTTPTRPSSATTATGSSLSPVHGMTGTGVGIYRSSGTGRSPVRVGSSSHVRSNLLTTPHSSTAAGRKVSSPRKVSSSSTDPRSASPLRITHSAGAAVSSNTLTPSTRRKVMNYANKGIDEENVIT